MARGKSNQSGKHSSRGAFFQVEPNESDLGAIAYVSENFGKFGNREVRKFLKREANTIKKKVARSGYSGTGGNSIARSKGGKNSNPSEHGHLKSSLQTKTGAKGKQTMGYYQRVNFKFKKAYLAYFHESGTKHRYWKGKGKPSGLQKLGIKAKSKGKSTGVLPARHPFEAAYKKVLPDIWKTKERTADAINEAMIKALMKGQ